MFDKKMTSQDLLSGAKYRIEGIYGIKFYQDEILRDEKPFTQYLSTEWGVLAWVEEQSPFVSIKITNLTTGEDVTEDFVGNNVEFVKSRHDQPLIGGTLKDIYK